MVKVLHNLEYKADEVGTSGYPATIISFQMTDDTTVKLIDSITSMVLPLVHLTSDHQMLIYVQNLLIQSHYTKTYILQYPLQ